MLSKSLRLDFERVILASAIMEAKFPVISKYLNEKNFTIPQHKTIFKALTRLFPLCPIDLLTIKKELEELNNDENWPLILVNITNSLASAANVDYYCLVILENDVVNYFLELLQKQSSTVESEVHKVALNEVITEFKESINHDSLYLIRNSISYLEGTSYPAQYISELDSVKQMIETKVTTSKRLLYLEVLIKHLISFCDIQYDTERRDSIKRLSNMIVAIGFSTQLPNNYFSKIKSLADDFA